MYERNERNFKHQSYSTYIKAAYASVFTIGTLLLAKSTGILPLNWFSEESNSDNNGNNIHEKRALSHEAQSSLIQGSKIGQLATPGISEDIVVSGNFAFSAQGSLGLQIADIRNASNPILSASYNTTGLAHKVIISGRYAFVAADAAGLQILNITNIYNLSLLGIYMADFPVTKLAVLDNKAYLGGDNGAIDIVDVSDPSHVLRVKLVTGFSSQKSIVLGNIAYHIQTQGHYGSPSGILVVDVSDPKIPNILKKYNSFNLTGFLNRVGNIAYFSTNLGVTALDVRNSNDPKFLGNFSTLSSIDMKVVGNIAYILNYYYPQCSLTILDISNPSSLRLLGNCTIITSHTSATPPVMKLTGSIIYITMQGSCYPDTGFQENINIIQAIDISNPRSPSHFSGKSYTCSINNVNYNYPYVYLSYNSATNIVGSIAYITARGVLQLIDLSDPNNPISLSNYTTGMPDSVSAISILNSTIYLAGNYISNYSPVASVLQIIDISNLSNPRLLGSCSFYGYGLTNNLKVNGSTAYLYHQGGGGTVLEIIDVSNPRNPNIVGNYFDKSSGGLTVESGIAYFSRYSEKEIVMLDVRQPQKNEFNTENHFEAGALLTDLTYSANNIFFTDSNLGLNVIDSGQFFMPSYINIPLKGVFSVLSVFSNIVYLGNATGVQMINISNSKNPVLRGEIPIVGGVSDMTALGTYLFVASESGLQIFDMTNISFPLLLSIYPIPGGASYVAAAAKTAYVSSPNFLYIIDTSVAEMPTLLGYNSGIFSHLSVVGTTLYADQGIFDASYPERIILLGAAKSTQKIFSFSTGVFGYQVNSSRRTLQVTGNSNPSISVNLATCFPPVAPVAIKLITATDDRVYIFGRDGYLSAISTQLWKNRLPMSVGAMKVIATDEYAYVADLNGVLHLINVSNPSKPTEVSNYILPHFPSDFAISGDFLYAAAGVSGIEIFDVSNPLSPQLSGRITSNLTNAKSVYVVNNQFLYVGDVRLGLVIFDIPEKLVVVNNQLTLTQGQTVNVTLNDVSARDTRQIGFYPQIGFSVINAQHGQFKVVGDVSVVTQFTQQQIINGVIQFVHDGSLFPPSYSLTANNDALVTFPAIPLISSPIPVNVTFYKLLQPPVLIANNITINERETLTLTQKDINATSYGLYDLLLQFTVNNIGNGRFQHINKPGVFITQFNQEQIFNGSIQFVQLGTGADRPFYQVSVSDGELLTNFTDGFIDFDAAPQLLKNTLSISNGETIIITSGNLQASDFDNNNATLVFKLSNIMHGNFISSKNGIVTTFTQQDITDGAIRFVHDGLGNAPSYTVSVSDGRASSQNQTATVSFVKQNNGQFPTLNIRPLIINQGEVVVITAKEISANSTVSDPQLLKFTASQVSNGRFQLTTNPGVSITEFLQSQITNSTVQFVHLGSGIDKPAFKVSVADDLLASPIVDGEIDFDAAPQLIDNKLSIINGKTVTLTNNDLRAIDIDSDNATLKFQISDITHGQFKVADNLQPLNTASFSQQQIVDRVISFIHDGSGIEPSYFVTVSDGRASTAKQLASVFFSNAANRQKPVLGNHQFFINQNDIITLTHQEINASSASVENSTLLFIVDKIGNGRFQLATEPGIFITQFSQEKIINGNIQFAHTGSGIDKPSYTISVSDGELSTDFFPSIIDFNAAPQLINNTININNGETIIIKSRNLQAIDIDSNNATLIFDVSNVEHGKFISSKNNRNNSAINQFIQQDITDGFIQFVHDGSNTAPVYLVSVSDGRTSSQNQTATVLFDNTKNTSNTPAIIGGVVAGVGGAGLLLAGLGLFAKNQINQATRNKHRLAAYIWQELKLQGVDNFGTDLGKKYVSMIENDLIPELKQHGYDTDTMEDRDLRELAKNIATTAKNKISHSTTFFGSSLITVDDLSRNISGIVQGILEENVSDITEDNYHLLEDDDTNVPLKSYMPSFHLSSDGYDKV